MRSRTGRRTAKRWPGPLVLTIAALAVVITALVSVATGARSLPAPTRTAAPSATAAFLGDSYTVGRGATDAATQGWAPLVAAAEGWVLRNDGVSGTGYGTRGELPGATTYLERVAGIAAQHPDVVVVSGGYNDLRLRDRAWSNSAVERVYVALRRALPHARIIAVGPFWPGAAGDARLTALDRRVQAAAARVGAQYLTALQPNPIASPGMVSVDGVHPNDAGHAALAAAVVRQLTAPPRS
jgi:lysophospholipase L1-like esterase